MKLRPEILLNNDKNLKYNLILVSGSDETLIAHITEFIVNNHKINNYYVDRSGEINNALVGDLFSDKKVLFLLKEPSLIKKVIEINRDSDQTFLISSSNNKSLNPYKAILSKSKTSLVVDCYPLNRAGKELFLNNYVFKNNLQLSRDVFFYIIENFDNELVFFYKQLQSLSLLKKEVNDIGDIEKIVNIENKIEINKIFFSFLKNNMFLINVFKKNIYSQGDLYFFFNSLKLYIDIIANASNQNQAVSSFPKYLFNEKDVFIKIFNLLDKKKILKIYKNIHKAENLIRKSPSLYRSIGLRFLLNTKKIIFS